MEPVLVDVAELAGLSEVCEIIGFTDGYVSQLLTDQRSGFPKPVIYLKCGRIWDARQVRAWQASRVKGVPGRPPVNAVNLDPERLSALERQVKLDALLGRGR